jgi:molybdate transport system ATP-binding protein
MNHVYPIVELRNVQVHIGSQVVLSGIDWELSAGENWAVLGANGAGKTTFLRLVRGDIWPTPGKGTRTYYMDGVPTRSSIGFRTRTGMVSPDLLDQYRRMGWNLTGTEVILSGFWGTAYVHRKPDFFQIRRTDSIIDALGLGGLVQRRILALSQGQAKRILIARALVHNPRILILDEVCESLDKASRECVLDTIQRAAEMGTQILYATHMTNDLVPAVTHVLKLDAGRIVDRGTREETGLHENEPIALPLEHVATGIGASLAIAKKSAPYLRSGSQALNGEIPPLNLPLSKGGWRDLPGNGTDHCSSDRTFVNYNKEKRSEQEILIRIKDADVYLDRRKILHELDWTMKPGENWAVLGENGSGKTTLLKLLIGDVRPRLGGSILRFGDDNPKTIREIRRRMSLVSADLQAAYMDGQTGLQTVLSGFFGSIGLHDTPTQRQVEAASDWIAFFGLDSLASRDIRTLSYGQFRMFLIARAMVTGPDILLLDEPTAGLDTPAAQRTLSLIENLTRHGTCIVYVTHRPELMPGCITNVAVMHGGRFTFQGSRRQFDSLRG